MRPAIITVNRDKLSEKKVQIKWKSLKEKSQKDTNTCVKIAAFRLVSKTIKEKKVRDVMVCYLLKKCW